MKRHLKLAALLLPLVGVLLSGCIIEERGYHHPYWGPHFHDGR